MSGTLVDSSVLLDVLTQDVAWYAWSATALEQCANEGTLYVNPLIYAEVSIGFDTIEEVEAALPEESFRRLPLPLEAAFLAGKAIVRYGRLGGSRTSTLPDFFMVVYMD
ncbi:MAG: PIN domain-containing protein [Armatimonadota bacterium]|nr:PIN domain-containing protein [Armatimonadota bacterium]